MSTSRPIRPPPQFPQPQPEPQSSQPPAQPLNPHSPLPKMATMMYWGIASSHHFTSTSPRESRSG